MDEVDGLGRQPSASGSSVRTGTSTMNDAVSLELIAVAPTVEHGGDVARAEKP